MIMPPSLSIVSLTAMREHLLLVALNQAVIDRLKSMAVQSHFHIGIIGDEVPLLGNLSAMENIALGAMYHHGLSLDACRKKMEPTIAALDLANVMDQRQQFLTRPQRLKIQLLRCLAGDCGFVLLDSPPHADCDVLRRALDRMDEDIFLWVCCLSTDRDVYSFLDYTHVGLDTFG